jgi:hypothetical protein
MREMFSGSMITVTIAGAIGLVSVSVVGTHAQGPAASGTATAAAALKTPWGEPDLQVRPPNSACGPACARCY